MEYPDPRGHVLLVNALAFGIITFLVVAYRIAHRIYHRKQSASDLALAAALVSSIAQDVFNANCVLAWGYGQHGKDLPHDIRTSHTPIKLLWLNQILFKFTTMCFKLSICLAYWSLFRRLDGRCFRATRHAVYFIAFLIVGYYSCAFFVSIFQCYPMEKSWMPKLEGHCIDLQELRFYTAAANIITSVLVIAVPIPALLRICVTIPAPRMLEVVGLILLGLFHTGCTIVRLVIMLYPAHNVKTDPQWANINPLTIAIVEMDIGIIAASLVLMRGPLINLHHFLCNFLSHFSPRNIASYVLESLTNCLPRRIERRPPPVPPKPAPLPIPQLIQYYNYVQPAAVRRIEEQHRRANLDQLMEMANMVPRTTTCGRTVWCERGDVENESTTSHDAETLVPSGDEGERVAQHLIGLAH